LPGLNIFHGIPDDASEMINMVTKKGEIFYNTLNFLSYVEWRENVARKSLANFNLD